MRLLFAVIMALTVIAASASSARASTCPAPDKKISVKVPGHPFAALASGDDCWLFVSLTQRRGEGAIAVLRNDAGSFKIYRTVGLQGPGMGEALSSDGMVLAVATGNNLTLLSIPELENKTHDPRLGSFATGAKSGTVYVAFGKDGRTLFASEERAHQIGVFDFSGERRDDFRRQDLIGNITTGAGPVGLALSPDGQWLYATVQLARKQGHAPKGCKPEFKREHVHRQGALLRISVALARAEPRKAVTSRVPAGCNPVRVAVSPSGKFVWVTVRGGNALWRFDAGELRAAPMEYSIGSSPVGVAVRPDGKQVWVAASDRFKKGKPQLVGLKKLSETDFGSLVSIPSFGFPHQLSFLPGAHVLVVTLTRAKRVEFVPTSVG